MFQDKVTTKEVQTSLGRGHLFQRVWCVVNIQLKISDLPATFGFEVLRIDRSGHLGCDLVASEPSRVLSSFPWPVALEHPNGSKQFGRDTDNQQNNKTAW